MARPSRAKRAVGKDGVEYRSGFEKNISEDLDKLDIEYEFEKHQLRYSLPVRLATCADCGSKKVIQQHTYTPDFYLPEHNIFIETKGRFVPKDRAKMLAIKQQYPELDIRMVFYADSKLTKVRPGKYSDWCKQHGFKFAIKKIPQEWLEEFI